MKYGYAENVNQMRQRLRYDIMYLENISLVLDLKILLFTIRTVLRRGGKVIYINFPKFVYDRP